MNANASSMSSGWSDGAACSMTLQFSAPGSRPAVDTKSKYARTVPVNASAMPTEQMSRYFHEASTDAFVGSSGMARADTIVVASIATHISATLFAVTAASMVNANAFWKIVNRRAVSASPPNSGSSPGPSADASSETNAMQTTNTAANASTRHRSVGAAAGSPTHNASAQSQMPARSGIAASATLAR